MACKTFQDGKIHKNHIRLSDKQGKIKLFHCTSSVALRDNNGKPLTVIEITRDVTEKVRAAQALKIREKELEIRTQQLEKFNHALEVLLKKRDEEKKNMEESVTASVRHLVVPYIEKLKSNRLGAKDLSYVDLLESNINQILSPFSKRLSSRYLGLTPMEIKVAGLIREGKTTKEIAAFQNISTSTVIFHRNNIRKKLGLLNKKINLRAHLHSIQ